MGTKTSEDIFELWENTIKKGFVLLNENFEHDGVYDTDLLKELRENVRALYEIKSCAYLLKNPLFQRPDVPIIP